MKSRIWLFFLLPAFCFSQERKIIGKIETETMLSNVLVVNLTQETETQTDGFGRFSMEAQVGDLLIFTGEFVQRTRFLVEEEHFGKENIIPLEFREVEIETVDIERLNINPEDLGLVPKGQKTYTKTERRLYTAGRITIGTTINVDAIINAISGRTKMLKLLDQMDKEDKRFNYLSNVFDDEYFTETLKINPDNITEFKYYALYHIEKGLDNSQKEAYIRGLSKDRIEILLIPLAEEYLSLNNKTLPNED